VFVHWDMWQSITPLFDLTDEEETEANVAASDSEERGEERAQPPVVEEEEEEGERGCDIKKLASGAQVGAMRLAEMRKFLVFVRLPF
jgi:hypothetical protein